jgi:hypothetical protein
VTRRQCTGGPEKARTDAHWYVLAGHAVTCRLAAYDVPADAASTWTKHPHRPDRRTWRDLIFFAATASHPASDVPRGALARQGRDIVDLAR